MTDPQLLDDLAAASKILDEQPVPQTDRALAVDGEIIYHKPSRETLAALAKINKKYQKVLKRLASR